jgi:hypothetical protein
LVPGGEVSGYGAAASSGKGAAPFFVGYGAAASRVVTTVASATIACGTATYTGDIVSGRAAQSNYNNSLSRGRETFGGVHASGPHDVVEDINGGKSPSRDGETFSGVHAHGPHDVFEEIKGGKGLSKGRQTFSGVHAQPHDVEEDACTRHFAAMKGKAASRKGGRTPHEFMTDVVMAEAAAAAADDDDDDDDGDMNDVGKGPQGQMKGKGKGKEKFNDGKGKGLSTLEVKSKEECKGTGTDKDK